MTTTPATRSTTDWNLAVLGGLGRAGIWHVARRIILITLIGGAPLDLREAIFDTDQTTITKISLIGGVKVTAPDGVRVETTNFSVLGGTKVDPDRAPASTEHVVRVRNFALIGGIGVA